MKTKPLTFLLALTFLFLFSGSVFGQETEVKKKYHDSGIQSALGREGRVGGIAAFDRIIACQQKTQTPCN